MYTVYYDTGTYTGIRFQMKIKNPILNKSRPSPGQKWRKKCCLGKCKNGVDSRQNMHKKQR